MGSTHSGMYNSEGPVSDLIGGVRLGGSALRGFNAIQCKLMSRGLRRADKRDVTVGEMRLGPVSGASRRFEERGFNKGLTALLDYHLGSTIWQHIIK